MKIFSVGNLKANFSQALEDIKNGEEIIIEYGKKHERLAVIIPYKKFKQVNRKIGILEGEASYKIKKDFQITDNELFSK